MTDLAIAGGRVVDPGRGIDDPLGVAVTGSRVTALGEVGHAAETIDASGLVLVPGLVDLHTHLYQGVSHYGIDPDANCLCRGVTTAVDAGSAIRCAGQIGSLAPGREADLTGFELRTGEWALPDGAGATEVVETLVVPRLVVRSGQAHQLDPVIRGPASLVGPAGDRGPARLAP